MNRSKTPVDSLPLAVLLAALTTALGLGTAAAATDAGARHAGLVPEDAHDCLVEPHTVVDVGSPAQGIVERLLVDRGESVVRGQPIVELESAMERAALAQAEARAEMRSEIVSREADLGLARLDLHRFEDLHARRLAPEQQRDEASARQQVASAALVQALENQKLLYLDLQRARRVLEQRTVKSPVDGVVVRQLLFPGELVTDAPLMTIARLDPLRVEVVLPSRLFGTLRKGQGARIYLELGEDEPVPATVEVVDPLLDTRSGTFGVRLHLPNPDSAIAAGQKCRVTFDEPPIAAATPEAAGEVSTAPSSADGTANAATAPKAAPELSAAFPSADELPVAAGSTPNVPAASSGDRDAGTGDRVPIVKGAP